MRPILIFISWFISPALATWLTPNCWCEKGCDECKPDTTGNILGLLAVFAASLIGLCNVCAGNLEGAPRAVFLTWFVATVAGFIGAIVYTQGLPNSRFGRLPEER